MPNDDHDRFAHLRILTMKQLSELTSYTPQHIYRLIRAKRIPAPIRMGLNRIGFRLSDIEKWMAERPVIEPRPDDDFDQPHMT